MTELTAQQRAEMRAAAEWLVADFEAAKPMVYGSEARTELPAANVIALLDLCDRLEKERDEARGRVRALDSELRHHDGVADAFRSNGNLWRQKAELAETALAAEREHASALAAALEPFARYAAAEDGEDDELRRFLGRPSDLCAFTSVGDAHLLIGDLRRAASALDAHRAREGKAHD